MSKLKKYFGVVWFVLFITSITLFGAVRLGGTSPIKKYISDRWGEVAQYLPGGGRSIKSLVTQEVVQEESVVVKAVENVSPAVVSIVQKTFEFDLFSGPSRRESGIGTGFIVEQSGLIITNSHVVNNSNANYSVVLKDGTTYDVNKVHLDESTDIAILEITARNLPTVELGDSDSLKVGQKAIAIGNALGQLQNTVTVGVISGISRQITTGGAFGSNEKVYESVIQTDAALNPGNSGGPLLNSAGQVIGVNVATTPGADNISFAIPVNTVKPIIEIFLKEGKIVKPYIGVYYMMVTKEIAALRNLPIGAYVTGVLPQSPADTAGIKRGDIITKIDEFAFDGQVSLASRISKKRVGDSVSLVVDRGGKEIDVKIKLAEVPQSN